MDKPTMPVNDEVLAEGIRLSEKATKQPYKASNCNWRGEPTEYDRYISGNFRAEIDDYDDTFVTRLATLVAIVPGNPTSGTITFDTADYIVHACNHFPAVAAELLELRQRVKELEESNQTGQDQSVA